MYTTDPSKLYQTLYPLMSSQVMVTEWWPSNHWRYFGKKNREKNQSLSPIRIGHNQVTGFLLNHEWTQVLTIDSLIDPLIDSLIGSLIDCNHLLNYSIIFSVRHIWTPKFVRVTKSDLWITNRIRSLNHHTKWNHDSVMWSVEIMTVLCDREKSWQCYGSGELSQVALRHLVTLIRILIHSLFIHLLQLFE